jgi:branched-chain amino acid transport system substrate-binding protein
LPAAVGNASSIDDSVRRKVIDEVGKSNFDGASGRVAFDQFGDTVTRTLTMNKVEGGAFTPIKSGEFAG